MTITKTEAKRIATEWGWMRLPAKGREYIRVHAKPNLWKFSTLVCDVNGSYRFYRE